ncbi:MAG: nitroreductase [Proteobacteria bacterium]|nr:nitroreductase [Verrucomicrobiota bacterium]NBU09022.1 nitroreductase [Pseudomonadota bacterium]
MQINPNRSAWDVTEDEFPRLGSPADKLRFMLRYAVLAPSNRNSQPWLFKVRGRTVELYADRTRSLKVTDPMDRQLLISCGCALFNLRVAMWHFGYLDNTVLLPAQEYPDLLARVTLGEEDSPTSQQEALFAAIPKRRTNRQHFKDDPLPEGLKPELVKAATREQAWLHFVDDRKQRNALADLIAEAERLQWADKHFRSELASWLHSNHDAAPDGIPNSAQNAGDLLSVAGPMVVRSFDLGEGQAAKDRDIAAYSPGLVVLGTDKDEPWAWVSVGQALARVLLRARVEGVSASYLDHPIEVAALRPKVTELIGHGGHAHIILRLGFGPNLNPTPRRTAAEVLMRPEG